MMRARVLLALSAMSLASCAQSTVLLGGRPDGGARDAGAHDAGPADAPMPDTGPPDAARPDAGPSLTPFANGPYQLTISPTSSMIVCGDALAGMEAMFSGVTRDSVGLVEGPVVIRGIDATHLEVSGTPIDMGFLTPTIELQPGAAGTPGAPPDVWTGGSSRPAEPGPAGTSLLFVLLEADELTITPTGFDGKAGAQFVDLVDGSMCAVAFDAHFGAL